MPPPFDEVLARYEREIMRFILRSTRDREDALDLFQETWLRAYRAYPELESPEGVRPWLYRIATNLCLNRSRDRARRAQVIADGIGIDDHAPVVSDHGRDDWIHLKTVIDRLPRKQRTAILMRKFGGLDYDEIGRAIGCSVESARADVYQAMKKLRLTE